MKVYLAGLHHAGYCDEQSAVENVAVVVGTARAYPYHLESYHYLSTRAGAAEDFRGMNDRDVFLDSGAYTAYTQGGEISLPAYGEYAVANADWINVVSNLDHIGAGREQESYDNMKALEARGLKIIPVHHARDRDEWLQRYIDEGYDYIALGGAAVESRRYLVDFYDHVWGSFLTHADGSARVRIHGFGLTTLDLMQRYPWHSVDSTRWVWLGTYGQIFVDFPDGRDVMVCMSSRSPRVHTLDAHYDNLSTPNKMVAEARIREMGYDPEQLREVLGMRHKWNIEFFRRVCERPAHRFKKQQVGLFG